jgi:pyrimidine operon attenuation protein / uracil phosphoribosyltransferase
VTKGARVILDKKAVDTCMDRLARDILKRTDDFDTLAVIGIRRRGVPIADRIATRIAELRGRKPRTGALDITLYRDDLSLVAAQPVVSKTEIDYPVDGLRVVLCDDVLFTGRTVRAAMDALLAIGRPARIELAVLVDRGFRELPIEANYVAETVDTTLNEVVKVHLEGIDDADYVEIVTAGEKVK